MSTPPVSRRRTARALEAIAASVSARPWAVLAVAGALALAAAACASSVLRMHVDTDAMIAADLPHQQRWRDFGRRHPLLASPLVVVVEGPPGEAGRAAQSLAAAMRARSDLFREVRAPGRDAFFRRHGLLYASPEQLAEQADRLVAAQPMLAALARDPSLRGLFGLLDDAADWPEHVPAESVARLLDGIAGEVEGAVEGRAGGFSLAGELLGAPAALDSGPALVLARTRAGSEGLNPAREAIDAIHALARESGLGPDSGHRVRVTGDLALSADELELLSGNALVTGVVSFVLVTGILALGLRSPRLVLALCLTLVVGLAWTAGFAALAVGRLNMISVAFAVMSIGLGVDFGIHLGARHRERVRRGAVPRDALRGAIADTGGSLLLCAATTTAAFYAFVPTDFTGLAEFGWISGSGILLSLLATLVVLPAAIAAFEPHFYWRRSRPPGRLDALLTLARRRPAAVLWAVGIASVAALAVLPQLRFAGNPLELRDPDSESASAFRDLLAREDSTTWNLQVVGRSPQQARRLAAELERLDVVARATTLSDWVPGEQEVKLAILKDLALVLGPLGPPGEPPDAAERAESLDALGDDLDCEPGDREGPVAESACRLRAAAQRLLARLDGDADRDATLAALERRLLGRLPERIAELRAALGAGRVTLASLPPEFTELWRAADGTWRVEVVPAGRLESDAALAGFVEGVRAVAPDATGMGVNVLEAERVVVRSLRVAFALAALAIAALLFARWRRVGEVARVLLPLGLSALWILAAATLLGMPLNFANVIVLPLILGIGIDSGVHMVDRARRSAAGDDLLRSSTAHAILLSALTTLASFGSLAFSPHPGMASMGRLLALGVVTTLLANLVVLPALLALDRGRGSARDRGARGQAGVAALRPRPGVRRG